MGIGRPTRFFDIARHCRFQHLPMFFVRTTFQFLIQDDETPIPLRLVVDDLPKI